MDYTEYTKGIRAGNRMLFREYVDLTFDRVYALVFKMITDRVVSEDIVQESYIKVWEKRESLKADGSLFSWTMKIASNKCLDYLRKRKRWNHAEGDEYLQNLNSETYSDTDLNSDELIKIVDSLTMKLSPKQRIVFTLSVLNELSAEEVCEYTGMSKEQVKSNLYHARSIVKKKLEPIRNHE